MEEDIRVLENFCEVFRMSQKSLDKYDRENYGEIIGQEEIQAIENLIARNKEWEDKYRRLQNSEAIKQNYIPKAEAEELLQKLDKEEKQELKGAKGQDRYFIKQIYQAKRSTIQELLQEN